VLRPQTGGEAEVSVEGGTVGDALRALAERYLSTKEQLFSSEGELNCYVSVYLNDEDVRVLNRLETVRRPRHSGHSSRDGWWMPPASLTATVTVQRV
jgi:sulfur-carrier protein